MDLYERINGHPPEVNRPASDIPAASRGGGASGPDQTRTDGLRQRARWVELQQERLRQRGRVAEKLIW